MSGMSLKTWKANIKLKSGIQEVRIQADNFNNAKAMLEATYGKGSISFGPIQIIKNNQKKWFGPSERVFPAEGSMKSIEGSLEL
jgi:hypothetical protein